MRISDWSSDVCSSDLLDFCDDVLLNLVGASEDRNFAHREVERRSGGDPAEFGRRVSPVVRDREAGRAGQFERQFGHALLQLGPLDRSEEHTSELQSLMRISYAVFCLKKKTKQNNTRSNE